MQRRFGIRSQDPISNCPWENPNPSTNDASPETQEHFLEADHQQVAIALYSSSDLSDIANSPDEVTVGPDPGKALVPYEVKPETSTKKPRFGLGSDHWRSMSGPLFIDSAPRNDGSYRTDSEDTDLETSDPLGLLSCTTDLLNNASDRLLGETAISPPLVHCRSGAESPLPPRKRPRLQHRFNNFSHFFNKSQDNIRETQSSPAPQLPAVNSNRFVMQPKSSPDVVQTTVPGVSVLLPSIQSSWQGPRTQGISYQQPYYQDDLKPRMITTGSVTEYVNYGVAQYPILDRPLQNIAKRREPQGYYDPSTGVFVMSQFRMSFVRLIDQDICVIRRIRYDRPSLDILQQDTTEHLFQENIFFNDKEIYGYQWLRLKLDQATKEPILSTRCVLCPYCKQLRFFNIQDPSFSTHMALCHGIYPDGFLAPDPLYAGIYTMTTTTNYNNREVVANQSEHKCVVCPACYLIIQINFWGEGSEKDELSFYLRHFTEAHQVKMPGFDYFDQHVWG
ncbi:hypothetical protein FT663_04849 [Candidozyma haemuli var. vulneris]|uniref:Transcription regulator Rua1 C-terminal domain-containing protein n=1 Tax=Candidozyma haemuli TaxID=45357 RepID=A0A2V1AWB6_9ASCO|nr:hypothetical protein CXQ85_004748 [[Candida] haemuloni]KAF3985739.1 hypothetical protein FT662_04971 [[Candida] haemuloni var. vulneris]KAF3986539.1 hypothetical protein FT663_04849 [[Candida] haemuloni var. vulneris]PVH22079.1 hypothetical protein CXQ85_004748 [[Candida] haemuloni]